MARTHQYAFLLMVIAQYSLCPLCVQILYVRAVSVLCVCVCVHMLSHNNKAIRPDVSGASIGNFDVCNCVCVCVCGCIRSVLYVCECGCVTASGAVLKSVLLNLRLFVTLKGRRAPLLSSVCGCALTANTALGVR